MRPSHRGALFTPERGGSGKTAVRATARVMAARVPSYSLFSIGFTVAAIGRLAALNGAARQYRASEPGVALVDTQTGVSYSTSSKDAPACPLGRHSCWHLRLRKRGQGS